MTTPAISEAAIQAAADAIEKVHTMCDCSEHLDEYARAALDAALPLLESRRQWGLRTVEDDMTVVIPYWNRNDAAELLEPGTSNAIVQRPVWFGEWTETTDE